MNKKGFTLVELLGVIVVIVIIAGLAVIGVRGNLDNGKKAVYNNFKNTLVSATKNYYIDNPDEIPEFNASEPTKIEYKDLYDLGYIDELIDPNNGNCKDSYVKVERFYSDNIDLSYTPCLVCKDNKNNYTYDDTEFCNNTNTSSEGQYCATFILNGASKIDGVAANKSSVCCSPERIGESCDITSPVITPKTNYEVMGWSRNPDVYPLNTISITDDASTNGSPKTISISDNTNFYAITRSKSESLNTYNVVFYPNSILLNDEEEEYNVSYSFDDFSSSYNTIETFPCRAEYTYNGAPLSTTCEITLPSIKRDDGISFGWDKSPETCVKVNEENVLNDNTCMDKTRYMSGETVTFTSSDLTTIIEDGVSVQKIPLYAITGKPLTLTIDPTGGDTAANATTTVGTTIKYAYNDELGTDLIIPPYENNVCRTIQPGKINPNHSYGGSFGKNNPFTTYKYIGLSLTKKGTKVDYCQGQIIWLDGDKTLYAVYNEDYVQTNVKSGSSVNLRDKCSSTGNSVGIMHNDTTVYLKEWGTQNSSGNRYFWYWANYGTKQGCATAQYYSPKDSSGSYEGFPYKPPINSCDRTDYVCNGGTAAAITLTPGEGTINLMKEDQRTIDVTVDSRCGPYEVTSSNPSVATVSRKNDNIYTVTGVLGSISEGQTATVNITATSTKWEGSQCKSTPSVITIKNNNDVPPTVSVSNSNTTSTNGGSTKVTKVSFTAKCSSIDPIKSFTVAGSNVSVPTSPNASGEYTVSKTITYTSTGTHQIKAVCTLNNGLSASKTSSAVTVYKYSASSACGTSVSGYTYSGTCRFTISGTNIGYEDKTCNSTIYNYGGCSKYCTTKMSSFCINSSGTCTRSTKYANNTCWHT